MFLKGIGIFMSFEHKKNMILFMCFSLEDGDEMGLGSKNDFNEVEPFCVILCKDLCVGL